MDVGAAGRGAVSHTALRLTRRYKIVVLILTMARGRRLVRILSVGMQIIRDGFIQLLHQRQSMTASAATLGPRDPDRSMRSEGRVFDAGR
jgi:hypothetical protein